MAALGLPSMTTAGLAGVNPPGFRLRMPKPAWWRRPAVWIAPLLFILGLLVYFIAPYVQREKFPEPDSRLPTIVIDAGHGGHDSGALGNGLVEKMLTLDTAQRLERQLRRRGYPVVMTRHDDTFLDLYERADIANALPNPFFVSIHYNDNSTTSGDGVETFYSAQKAGAPPDSLNPADPPSPCSVFAQTVQSTLVTALGVTDRGAKPRQLAVVRCARCPAVLVEGGFINNPSEARKLALPEYRERIAIAIADGIVSFQKQRSQPPPAGALANVAPPPRP